MADNTLTMFGKAYNTVGSANTNLMLQTKGDLKIRWGNKFIDLVKNGKINADSDILKTADSSENINTDGIYLIKNGEKDEIWICINKTPINLSQEAAKGFISYAEELKLTGEEKQKALLNIGIIFDTYANLVASGIKEGFAYVEESQKFYTITGGTAKEYTFDTEVADPLKIGGLTITGNTQEIAGNFEMSINADKSLSLKVRNSEKILMNNDGINCYQTIYSDNGILSYTYNNDVGYYIGMKNNKAIGVFDEIVVRSGISRMTQITYKELISLINRKALLAGCEYEITDFLDIRCITFDYETIYKDIKEPKNVYPIVIKAKSSSELAKEGYFFDNPNWTIEYDPYYNHIVKYESTETGYNIARAKGRITKMIDEFGNTANFDFKHSTFTDDKKYLFNTANNEAVDATLDVNTLVINNTIYLAEPELVDSSIDTTRKEIRFNDYIIFDDCSTFPPSNNIIRNVSGKYLILDQFSGNIIDSIVYNDSDEYQIFPEFTNNTAGIVYLNVLNSNLDNATFNVNSIYDSNTFGNITNTIFRDSLHNNSFKDLTDVTVDGIISNCTFKELSNNIYIEGPLSDIDILVDMTPSSALYVEDLDNTYILNSPFEISILNVPKLDISGKKTCTIETRSLNGSDIQVFIVKTDIDYLTPPGVIVMYNGLANQIPDGWAICDGTKGTPDLRGRFIRMVDCTNDTWESTGAKNNNDLVNNGNGTRLAYLDGAHIPQHTHTFNTYTDSYNIDISNLYVSYSGYADASTLTVSIDTADTYYIANSGNEIGKSAEEGTPIYLYSSYHNHNATVGGYIDLPSISIGGSASVSINVTPELGSESFPNKVNIEPLAYALIFIMKL